MKNVIAMSIVFFSMATFAEKNQDPVVSCEMMAGQVDSDGIAVGEMKFKEVPVSTLGSKATLNGFELYAKTTENCATDGGPCTGTYSFEVSIKKGVAKAGTYVQLQANEVGWNRYSTSLDVGKETMFVNCDYDTRK